MYRYIPLCPEHIARRLPSFEQSIYPFHPFFLTSPRAEPVRFLPLRIPDIIHSIIIPSVPSLSKQDLLTPGSVRSILSLIYTTDGLAVMQWVLGSAKPGRPDSRQVELCRDRDPLVLFPLLANACAWVCFRPFDRCPGLRGLEQDSSGVGYYQAKFGPGMLVSSAAPSSLLLLTFLFLLPLGLRTLLLPPSLPPLDDSLSFIHNTHAHTHTP